MDPAAPDPLHELASAYGIDVAYWDWTHEHRVVADGTLLDVLAAMDVDASTPQARAAALEEVRARRRARLVAPTVVARHGVALELALPAGTTLSVDLEDGTRRRGAPGLPADLPVGYHRLRVVAADGREQTAHLIVAPDALELPGPLRHRPGWGVQTQLYSVRSDDSWAVGDLGDLGDLTRWVGAGGGDFVLINPVHAGGVVTPLDPSPYLPSSRRFADPLYLRVEDVPEYALLSAADRARVDALGAPLRGVLTDTIDRDPVWTAKLAALQIVLAAGLRDERAAAFARYRDEQGVVLDRFATWCALCEVHGPDWRAWPGPLRDPGGAAVADAARDLAGRIGFYRQLQWLLDEQLRAVQARAREAGAGLGVVHDVAVGVSPSGADAWSHRAELATSVRVGAPPDAYSQLGQDWQQPPWRPDRLAETGYARFREMFATMLRYSGGLRVDHVLGLFRLWWIPEGRQALDGTYVHYDPDALFGVLAVEAQRAGAVIVGEDLGNVDPRVHGYLHDRGLFGTSILWFETEDGAPRAPQHWRELCLASVTTHDLPPTAGYLDGEHVRLRDRLGLLVRPVADELADARRERATWREQLVREGLLDGSDDSTDGFVVALHRFLARTPALLRAVALVDGAGDRRVQNQPGTSTGYPNWCVPLAGPDGSPVRLADVLDSPRLRALVDAVRPG